MQVGTYPTRNFATLGPSRVVTALQLLAVGYSPLAKAERGLIISASLYMSPCSSDYIIAQRHRDAERSAYSL